jgi:ATP-dependent helicase HrpB
MQQSKKIPLPIDSYLNSIVENMHQHSTLLIKAPPGSGKTTRLPLAVVESTAGKVLVLEPRRLAAKMAAQRICQEAGLKPGQGVGYHFRFEKMLTEQTRLIFYTEGTFLKKLIHDPELRGVDVVIIDEFHERHLETDAALAYLRSLQQTRDLKLILMSATLDLKLLESLPGSHSMEIAASQFPVAVSYLPNQPSILQQSLEQKVRQALKTLPPDSGDVLIFLPGMREMLKVSEVLGDVFGEVSLLHASLPMEEQARAMAPAQGRKIVLATNVAESSITIPGIRVVIDSGIQREAKFSPWHGLKYIADSATTQSSAIQRAGRAGRVAPGKCLRLYSQQDFDAREAFTIPEMFKADLTDLYLLSTQLQLPFQWYQPPPAERWQKARELCFKLGAVDQQGQLTSRGQSMQQYPLGVRLSRALQEGENLSREAKLRLLNFIGQEIEKDSGQQLLRQMSTYLNRPVPAGAALPWEQCLLSGFIDQVAKFRPAHKDFIHYSGKTLKPHSSCRDLHHDFYLILDITQRQEAITILPIEEEWLYQIEPFPFQEDIVVAVDEKIQLRRQTKLGSILLEEMPLPLQWPLPDQQSLHKILLQGEKIFRDKLQAWKEGDDYLRLHYGGRLEGQELEALKPHLRDFFEYTQALSWAGLEQYFIQYFSNHLAIKDLEQLLPSRIRLGGREFKIHYPFGLEPFVEAPIHEFYGLGETPAINRGQTLLTMKLLGPHKRPIQVTKDLNGFWQRTYQQMKKELIREYPRHHWPDDPRVAKAVLLKRQL